MLKLKKGNLVIFVKSRACVYENDRPTSKYLGDIEDAPKGLMSKDSAETWLKNQVKGERLDVRAVNGGFKIC